MFVSKELIPITEGPNTIYIRAKLGLAARNRVLDAVMQISNVDIAKMQEEGEEGATMKMALGGVNTMLMHEGIAKWEGPAFIEDGKPIRCTPPNIDMLDTDDPLVKRVLETLANMFNEKKSQESESDG